MNGTNGVEKLLKSPLDTPEISSTQMEKPLLTTEEFIKTTPAHELKNLFGAIPDRDAKPKNFQPTATPVIKATPSVQTPKIEKTQKEKMAVGKFFLGLFLILLVLLIGLYVWGGILKEKDTLSTTEALPQ